MTKIFYKPWIGENYEYGFNGKKILILGESHHCNDGCWDCGTIETSHVCNFFTQNIISTFLRYKVGQQSFSKWMNTFTRFANILKGKKLNNTEQIDFWKSIAFYNYVQKAISEARMSPTSNEFNNSLLAFHALIENVNPDLIIIWGFRLWNNLPKETFFLTELNDRNKTVAFYKNNNFKIPLKIIYHPSSSKLTYGHSIEINEFINQ